MIITKTIKKYLSISVVAVLLAVSLYAGYLKLKNNEQASKIQQQEQALSVAISANSGMQATIETLEADKKRLDKLLLERETFNENLEKTNAQLVAKLKAVKQDQYWNSAVLVPCDVVNSLFPNKGLGCRTQAE